jgi:hypothetical protein
MHGYYHKAVDDVLYAAGSSAINGAEHPRNDRVLLGLWPTVWG